MVRLDFPHVGRNPFSRHRVRGRDLSVGISRVRHIRLAGEDDRKAGEPTLQAGPPAWHRAGLTVVQDRAAVVRLHVVRVAVFRFRGDGAVGGPGGFDAGVGGHVAERVGVEEGEGGVLVGGDSGGHPDRDGVDGVVGGDHEGFAGFAVVVVQVGGNVFRHHDGDVFVVLRVWVGAVGVEARVAAAVVGEGADGPGGDDGLAVVAGFVLVV